jgi:hypothetical protein
MDMSTFPSRSEAVGADTSLVVVVADAMLRDSLAACFQASHDKVLVARDFADRRLAGSIGSRSVLVTDTLATASYPAGVSGVASDPRWSRAIVLAEHGLPTRTGDRLAFVARAASPMAVAALATEWLTKH